MDTRIPAERRAGAPTPVVFIGGLGRSGSTLLELLLTGVPGMVPVGEVRHLWARGLRDDDRCACGAPFSACPFWASVGDHSFGGWASVDADRTIALARRVDRHRQLLSTVPAWRERSHALRCYGEMLERLFAGILAVSGGEVVVDSSKDPPHGFVLGRTPGIDLRVVHLVRDSRGVADSWAKTVSRPDAVGGPAMMTRLAPWRTAMMWVDTNLLVEALGRGRRSLRLRYEDVATRPDEAVRRVGALAGLAAPGEIDPQRREHHAIGGNPVRFHRAPLDVSLDDRWRATMATADRRVVTALTAALLRRYGYRLRSTG
ncbi:MAG: sulfotransferase [Gaiellales bacterium]